MKMRDVNIFARISAALGGLLSADMSLHGRHSYMRPTGKALRDPDCPTQQVRIRAAATKRERRAKKLAADTLRAAAGNAAR